MITRQHGSIRLFLLVGLDEKTIEVVFDVSEKCSYKRLKEQFIKPLSVGETAKLNH